MPLIEMLTNTYSAEYGRLILGQKLLIDNETAKRWINIKQSKILGPFGNKELNFTEVEPVPMTYEPVMLAPELSPEIEDMFAGEAIEDEPILPLSRRKIKKQPDVED